MLLEHSARLADLSTLPEALRRDLFWLADGAVRPSPYWRPVVVLLYYLERALGGAPWIFHATNLLLLAALGALAVDGIAERSRRAGALLLVLAHPMQTEVALNITARTDLLAAIFGLLATRAAGPGGAALTLLALGSKESAVVVPLIAWLTARAEGDGRRARWLPHLGALGLWALVRTLLVSTWGVAAEDRGAPTLEAALAAPARILFYLGRLLWPIHPTAALALPAPGAGEVLAGLGILAVAAIWLTRGGRRWGAELGALLLPLLPVSGLLASPVRYAEGFLCWPVLGLARGLGRAAPPWLPLALALPCLWISVGRVPDWQDERALWGDARAAWPADPLVAGKYGRAIYDQDPVAAAKALRQALRGEEDPRRRREIQALLAQQLVGAGRWREAVPLLRAAARPEDPELSWPLASRCQVEAGERLPEEPGVPELRAVCAEAARRFPEDPDLWNAVGVEAATRGSLEEAAAAFRRAVALAPERQDLRENLRRAEGTP